MPAGAIVGLKKMLTSPFGPAILISIALLTVIGFQYSEIRSLKKDNETHISNSASLKVAKDVCENESKGLRLKLNKLTSDLKLMEMRTEEIQKKAKQKANETIKESIEKAEKEKIEFKDSKEMTLWYQDLYK